MCNRNLFNFQSHRFVVTFLASLLLLLILICAVGLSCAGGKSNKDSNKLGAANPNTGVNRITTPSILNPKDDSKSLAAAIFEARHYELSSSQVSPGLTLDFADKNLNDIFATLKDELLKELLGRGFNRFKSGVPASENGRVTDLDFDNGTSLLNWSYMNQADYDLSGEVGVSDITPIAVNYLQTAVAGTLTAWIDGDASGEVGVSDITPIAENYLNSLAGYRILTSEDAFTGFTELTRIAYNPTGADYPYVFEIPLPAGALRYIRVQAHDSLNAYGVQSNFVEVNPPPPSPPSIESVSPLSGTEGVSTTFSAVITGSVPATYAWSFGGGATPDTSSDASPTVTLNAAGSYNCSLDVSNEYGSDTFDFTLTVDPFTVQPLELWYYQMVNLYVDANVDPAIALAETAATAGYSKVVLADFKLSIIDTMNQRYRDNLTRYCSEVRAKGIEVIPALVPIGYSSGFMFHDPNLIEPMPVVSADFVVNEGIADVVQDAAMANGDFESYNFAGNTFDGWNQMDSPGVGSFVDTSTKHGGTASIRLENFTVANEYGNDRIRQAITVKPWNCYIVRFWLKTSGFNGSFNCFAFNSDFSRVMSFLSYNVSATQDWTEYAVAINSQDNSVLNLYMGVWSGAAGQMWIDDVTIENAGLINLIRRDGAPFNISHPILDIAYIEGEDYEYVSDPNAGYAGSWPGTWDIYHERPVITITPGSRIDEGSPLKVSYYHAAFVYDMQDAVCLSEPAVDDIIQTTMQQVYDLVNPEMMFVGIDELRCANWCAACQAKGKTAGGLLADITQRIDAIGDGIDPNMRLVTWSDMFDPNHNAHDNYYLVNGTLADSWLGLPSDWDIGNWNFGDPIKRDATLAHFAGLGNRQILCGFYDNTDPGNFEIMAWLTDAAAYDGIYACCYTTWTNNYNFLDEWAGDVREWESQQPAG